MEFVILNLQHYTMTLQQLWAIQTKPNFGISCQWKVTLSNIFYIEKYAPPIWRSNPPFWEPYLFL